MKRFPAPYLLNEPTCLRRGGSDLAVQVRQKSGKALAQGHQCGVDHRVAVPHPGGLGARDKHGDETDVVAADRQGHQLGRWPQRAQLMLANVSYVRAKTRLISEPHAQRAGHEHRIPGGRTPAQTGRCAGTDAGGIRVAERDIVR